MRVCLSGGGGGSAAATAAVGMSSSSSATLWTSDVGLGRGVGVDRERARHRSADAVCDRQSRAAMSVAGWVPAPQRVSRFLPAGGGSLRAAAVADFAAAIGVTAGVSDDGPRSGCWSPAAIFRGDLCHWVLTAPQRGSSGGGGGGALALGAPSCLCRRSKRHVYVELRPRCRPYPANGHADLYPPLGAARAYDDTSSADSAHDVRAQSPPVVCGTSCDRESVSDGDAAECSSDGEPASRQRGLGWGPGEREEERDLTVNGAWGSRTQHSLFNSDEGAAKREVVWEEELGQMTVEEEEEEEEAAAAAGSGMTGGERMEKENEGGWSNRSLNQKYRPRKLGELVGQARVAEALSNALAMERIAPAYIFSGPRGTGKTSAARIFAAALNCCSEDLSENSDCDGDRRRRRRRRPGGGRGREPCGQCRQCVSTLRGGNVDVREVDAATHNGVESIRELLSTVRLAPVCSSVKYKVYVIDECHMLSSEAANALLKTLEEAPAMAVFILVTTDPQRLPPTVLSRCLRFPFRRIAVPDMVSKLADVAAREGVTVESDALCLMALSADGALRDGETILEQMTLLQGASTRGGGGGKVTAAMVREFLGVVGEEEVCQLLTSLALADQFPERSLARIRSMTDTRVEPGAIICQLAALITDLLASRCEAAPTAGVWREGGGGGGGGNLPSSQAQARDGEEVEGHGDGGGQLNRRRLIELARTPDGLLLLRQMLGKLAEVEKQVRGAGNPQLWLEVGLVSLAESKISQQARDMLISMSSDFSGDSSTLPLAGSLSSGRGTAIAGARLRERGGKSAEGGGGVIVASPDDGVSSLDACEDRQRAGRAAEAGSLLSEVALPGRKAAEAVESSASPSLSSPPSPSPSSSPSPPFSSPSRSELSSSVSSAERREHGAARLEKMGKDREEMHGDWPQRRGDGSTSSKSMNDEDLDVDVQQRSSSSLAEEVVVMSRPVVEKKVGMGEEMHGDWPQRRGDGAIAEDAMRGKELTGGSQVNGGNEDGESDGRRRGKGGGGVRSGGAMKEAAEEGIAAAGSQAREEGDNEQETVGALPLDMLWEEVIGKVKLKTVRTLLENRGRLESFSQDRACVLFTVSEFAKRAEKNKHHIEAAFKKVCGSEVTVVINNVAESHSGNMSDRCGRRGADAPVKKQVRKARGAFESESESESPVRRGGGGDQPGGGDAGAEMAMSEGMKLRRGRRPLTARKYAKEGSSKEGSRKGAEEAVPGNSPPVGGGGGNDLDQKKCQLAKKNGNDGSSMGRGGAGQPDETAKKLEEEERSGPSAAIASRKLRRGTEIANDKHSDSLNLVIGNQIAGETGSPTIRRTQEEVEADCASEWEKETAKYTVGSGHRDGSEGPWRGPVSSGVSGGGYEGEVEWEADTEMSVEYLMAGSREDGEEDGIGGVLGGVNSANNMVLRKNRDEQSSDAYEGKTGSALVIERVMRNRNEKKKPLLPRKLEAAESIAKVFNGIVIPF